MNNAASAPGPGEKFLLIAVAGTLAIFAIPHVGLIALYAPTWVAFMGTAGVAVVVGFVGWRTTGPLFFLPLVFALFGSGFVIMQAADYRIIQSAEEHGSVSASEITLGSGPEAYFINDLAFGDTEGWYEVCGEESCTEYILVSLVRQGHPTDPIRYWVDIEANEDFQLDWPFIASSPVGSSTKTGIKRACRGKDRPASGCAKVATILSPIDPASSANLLTIQTYKGGWFFLFFFLFCLFVGYVRARMSG